MKNLGEGDQAFVLRLTLTDPLDSLLSWWWSF